MNKLVTKLLDNICTCRDIIVRGNLKEITHKIYIFETVTNEVKRQVNKLLTNDTYELDFNSQDLKELSEEIKCYLDTFAKEFDFNVIIERLYEYDIIDKKIVDNESERLAGLMYIDKKLRECYKLLSYLAMILWLLERKDT